MLYLVLFEQISSKTQPFFKYLTPTFKTTVFWEKNSRVLGEKTQASWEKNSSFSASILNESVVTNYTRYHKRVKKAWLRLCHCNEHHWNCLDELVLLDGTNRQHFREKINLFFCLCLGQEYLSVMKVQAMDLIWLLTLPNSFFLQSRPPCPFPTPPLRPQAG